MDLYFDGIHNDIPIHSFLQSLYYYPISRFQLHFLFPEGSAVLRWSEYIGALKLIVPQVFVLIYVFTRNAIGLDLSVQYAIYITSEYKSYTKLRCTFEFVEWVAHRSKSHGEGEQKAHEYTYFARIALWSGNYYLYALVQSIWYYNATNTGLVTEDIFYSIFSKFFPLGGDTYNGTWKFFKHLWKRVISFVCRFR